MTLAARKAVYPTPEQLRLWVDGTIFAHISKHGAATHEEMLEKVQASVLQEWPFLTPYHVCSLAKNLKRLEKQGHIRQQRDLTWVYVPRER